MKEEKLMAHDPLSDADTILSVSVNNEISADQRLAGCRQCCGQSREQETGEQGEVSVGHDWDKVT